MTAPAIPEGIQRWDVERQDLLGARRGRACADGAAIQRGGTITQSGAADAEAMEVIGYRAKANRTRMADRAFSNLGTDYGFQPSEEG